MGEPLYKRSPENQLLPGLCPGPRCGSSQQYPDPLAGRRELAAPLQEPHPRSRSLAFRASALWILLERAHTANVYVTT